MTREGPQAASDGSGTGPAAPRRRLRWHHLYYLLAAFDLLTVSFTLTLTHRILGIYTESVGLNQEWAERSARYGRLAQLSAGVNAPGNDVFDSRDVAGETRALEEARAAFQQAMAAARSDLASSVEPALGAKLGHDLDRAEEALSAMVAEAQVIFRHFQDRPEQAGRSMAEMDRHYLRVRNALDALQERVRGIQQANFASQTRAAVSLGRYEYVVAGFIALMVLGITFYGRTLARQIESHERQRERHLAHLREAEARTRAILDSAVEGILTTDQRGVIEEANPAAERIFGYAANELIGQNVSVLTPMPIRAEHDGYIRRYLETGEAHILGLGGREVLAQRKDGTVFPLQLAVSEVRRGDDRRLFTGLLHDISERKQAEALIRRYNEELEDTVRQRTAVLETALEKQSELAARNADAYEVIRRTQAELVRKERLAAVGELSAAVAHGIRNPLASIRACAEVEREDHADHSSFAETLDDIVGEVDRLEQRIRAVLDLARPFVPRLARGDLNRALERLGEDLRRRPGASVAVRLDLEAGLAPADFDPDQLHEVLEAIAVNAVEAMDGSGELTLGSRLEPGGDAVKLWIADTGPGLVDAQIERIFDLFFTTKPSGTGIGLAVARRIVEALGGSLQASQRPGGGALFGIRLPLRQSPGGEAS